MHNLLAIRSGDRSEPRQRPSDRFRNATIRCRAPPLVSESRSALEVATTNCEMSRPSISHIIPLDPGSLELYGATALLLKATSARSAPHVARVAPQFRPCSGIAPGTHEPHEPHALVLNHAQSRNRFFLFPGRDPAPKADVDRTDVGWVDGWRAHAFQLGCPVRIMGILITLLRWAGFGFTRPSCLLFALGNCFISFLTAAVCFASHHLVRFPTTILFLVLTLDGEHDSYEPVACPTLI